MNESLEKEAFDVKKFLVKHQKFEKKVYFNFIMFNLNLF